MAKVGNKIAAADMQLVNRMEGLFHVPSTQEVIQYNVGLLRYTCSYPYWVRHGLLYKYIFLAIKFDPYSWYDVPNHIINALQNTMDIEIIGLNHVDFITIPKTV